MSLLHLFGFKVVRTPGAAIDVDCPHCRRRTRARQERRIETVSILHLIPFLKKETNRTVCEVCGLELVGEAADRGLASRHYAKGQVRYERRLSPALKFVAMVSVLLALLPGVGPLFTLIAAIVCWRGGGWPKITTVAAFALSIVMGLVYSTLTVVSK